MYSLFGVDMPLLVFVLLGTGESTCIAKTNKRLYNLTVAYQV
jgi:hypothetical protein